MKMRLSLKENKFYPATRRHKIADSMLPGFRPLEKMQLRKR